MDGQRSLQGSYSFFLIFLAASLDIQDVSSPTMDQTLAHWEHGSLNHWTTRKIPRAPILKCCSVLTLEYVADCFSSQPKFVLPLLPYCGVWPLCMGFVNHMPLNLDLAILLSSSQRNVSRGES